jgi:hypothetical protein
VSRTDLRALLLVAVAAFALRCGAAVLTEFKPVFPAYYYNDAEYVDLNAREVLQAWSAGSSLSRSYSPSQKAHILFTALIYRAVGPHPIAAKLANALAAALGIAAFGLLAGRLFGPTAGPASAALIGFWPSHVFYTSQNFKEGLICGALMGAFLLLTPGADKPRGREFGGAAAGLALLMLLGFFRSYVMFLAAAALAAGAAAALLRRRGSRRAAALALSACLAAPILQQLSLRALLEGSLRPAVLSSAQAGTLNMPVIFNADNGKVVKPYSPRGISEFRRWRLHYDRENSLIFHKREISTQLFPDERMESWLDVLIFIPKASFHVLFMPLPGLYPMEGKLGRILASFENTGVLLIFVLGLVAALRGGLEPSRLGLLLFFAATTVASAFLEFDLGSAGRHKLMYVPMLIPFAVEEALRLSRTVRR